MSKAKRPTDERRKRMAEICKCGRPYSLHGAIPPHTVGEADEDGPVCAGFQPKKESTQR